MFWRGPVTWINRVGWRKMEDFEIQATWMIWREVGIRMGVKYMPEDYHELLKWKDVSDFGFRSGTMTSWLMLLVY